MWRDDWAKRFVSYLKARAKRRGLEFNLTAVDLVVPMFCDVRGVILEPCKGQAGPNSPSADRFDNSLGYVRGNVRIISKRANQLKSDGTLAEFKEIVSYMSGERGQGAKRRLQNREAQRRFKMRKKVKEA